MARNKRRGLTIFLGEFRPRGIEVMLGLALFDDVTAGR